MLSQKVIEENHTVRLNAHAEDITELIAEANLARKARHAHHMDFAELARRIGGLEQRHEGLVLAVAGLAKHEGSRTEELVERIEELESRLAFLTAGHNRRDRRKNDERPRQA